MRHSILKICALFLFVYILIKSIPRYFSSVRLRKQEIELEKKKLEIEELKLKLELEEK